ncbi:MAG: MFS transporter [Bacillota bacterium]|jgi:DHA1 family multidrug resistance protein-like MFS transporter
MEQWRRNLIVLWVGTVVAGISFSIVSPFLPSLLEQVGATSNLEVWSGWAFSATFYTSALLYPVWGALADKYGRRPQLLRAGLGIGIVYLLMSIAKSPLQVVLLRLLLGVFNGFVPTAVAMVATNTPEEHMGSALGTIQTGYAFGSVFGPLVGGYLSYFLGIQNTLRVAGFSLFFATLICFLGTTEAVSGDRNVKINIPADLRWAASKPLLLQMCMLVAIFNLSFNVIQPVLPLFIEQLVQTGDPTVATGVIYAIAGFATVMAAPFWGRRGQRIGFTRVLREGFLGAALISFVLVLSSNLYMLGGLRFLFGLFMAAVMPATNALIAKSVAPNFRSRALSFSGSLGQIGGAIGPVIGGYVGSLFGLATVFLVTGGFMLGLLLWMRRKQWDAQATQPSAAPSVVSSAGR